MINLVEGVCNKKHYLQLYSFQGINSDLFSLIFWHINHCRLFNAKSPLYTYIENMIWFGLFLWHINHFRLFNAKSIFKHINSSISNNSD